jgi:hypothetical protein
MKLWVTTALVLLAGTAALQAGQTGPVVVTSSNAATNELLVYDTKGRLIQSVATQGAGGVSQNSGGIAVDRRTVAVVNFGSGTVSLLTRTAAGFALTAVIPAASAPVSVAFGHDHLYVLGTSTIESHRIERNRVASTPDGITTLLQADGSAAQVGVVGDRLIVTEKSNVVETVELREGAVDGAAVAVELPAGSDTPFGLVTRGGNAYVTIAHSDEVALVKHGLVVAITATGTPGGSGQHAPCWLTLNGPYLYSSNSPSHTLSRFLASGRQILLEQPVAAHTIGAPTDIASREDRIAVIDADGAGGRLTQFAADEDGELTQLVVTAIPATANGIGFVDR